MLEWCSQLNMPALVQHARMPPARSPTAAQMAAVLSERFARDKRQDWKSELVRRRTALQVFQDEQAAAEAASAAAAAALEDAAQKLQAWQEAQEAARVAAEEEGLPPPEEVCSTTGCDVNCDFSLQHSA